MTLTELRYVVAVAEHRHFGRAADACFVSQPTLSVGIRKLEEELGVRLFERNRSEVIITPIGASIIAQATQVLAAANGVRELAIAARDPLGSELKLGVIYTIGPYLVPRLITGFKRRAPNLTLIIKENFTDDLAQQLRRGDIDAAIMSLPYRDPQLISRALYDEPFKVALPADHAMAKQKSIKVESLAEQTLLLLGAGNCFRDQVVEICPSCADLGRHGRSSLQKTLEGSSLDTICQMVAAGVGVTVIPATMRLHDDLAELIALKPFSAPQPSRTVAVFYRRGFPRPELINCIANTVRDAKLAQVKYHA